MYKSIVMLLNQKLTPEPYNSTCEDFKVIISTIVWIKKKEVIYQINVSFDITIIDVMCVVNWYICVILNNSMYEQLPTYVN